MKIPLTCLAYSAVIGLILIVPGCRKSAPAAVYEPPVEVHPRLLLPTGGEAEIRQSFEREPVWKDLHLAILAKCNDFLGAPLLERNMIGRRLLSVSRECIRRVFYLSYAYRMTGQEKFLQRAEQEMLAVAGFSDWNPSHFLDVAEMTMGMAIGYDWLYDQLSESSRSTIRQAIRDKGLEPSFDNRYNWFLGSTNNWNQVCNAGMTFGALAVADAYPSLAERVIERAIASIELPMGVYSPDGAYPEGYGYWGYGTTMNVLFLHAIEEAFGTDYGLSQLPGFLRTTEFLAHMLGPGGQCYNWGDNNLGGALQPAMFWLAQKADDPTALWMEKKFLAVPDLAKYTGNRLLPAMLIWARDLPLGDIAPPAKKMWVGGGTNPVALMRTSWTDPQAIYLGFKAGSPSVNHGHMDIGSFIMEADGVRWAIDLGVQNYESLESKGMQIFGKTQDAQRWTVFRFNNFAHNTLIVDGEHQRVDGYAQIDRYSEKEDFPFAVSDISTVYAGQLADFRRGVGIIDQNYVVIRDEIRTLDQPANIRWNMATGAQVTLGERSAILIQDGKQLELVVRGPEKLSMHTWSTEPTNDYDAPNPGTQLVGFEYLAPPNSSISWEVYLVPPRAAGSFRAKDLPLDQWE